MLSELERAHISASKSEIASTNLGAVAPLTERPRVRVRNRKPKPAVRIWVNADRVKARLLELRRTAAEVARSAGLERTFIADLLGGRKDHVNARNLAVMATALQCDPDYLTGKKPSPGGPRLKSPPVVAPGLPVVGIIGRRLSGNRYDKAPAPTAPVVPDPRFVGMSQALYAAPKGLPALGVGANAWLLSVDAIEYKARFGPWRDGQLLIVGLGVDGEEGEDLGVYRACKFPDRTELHPIGGGSTFIIGHCPEGRVVRIAAVVLRAVQELG